MNTTTFGGIARDVTSEPVMPMQRLIRAYLVEAKYELVRLLREPSFSITFLALPVIFYLFFGVFIAGSRSNATIAAYMFIHWVVVAVIGPGLFGFGMVLAMERKEGLLALKRALPMPPAAYLLAKMFMSMIFDAIVTALLIAAAVLIGRVNLGAVQLMKVWLLSVVGTLPFAALGLSVGVRANRRSAPAIVNLLYMPLMFLAGLFFPIPISIHWMMYLSPAFYLDQVLSSAAGLPVSGNLMLYPILLMGFTFVLTALSVRRLAQVG